MMFFIQLLASATTIGAMWCYGSRSKLGPLLGLIGQVPWWLIMIDGGLWGILPVNAAMLLVHTRNLWKWMKYE